MRIVNNPVKVLLDNGAIATFHERKGGGVLGVIPDVRCLPIQWDGFEHTYEHRTPEFGEWYQCAPWELGPAEPSLMTPGPNGEHDTRMGWILRPIDGSCSKCGGHVKGGKQ